MLLGVPLGAFLLPACLLGVSWPWVSLGVRWVPPGASLGVSWVHLGVFWLKSNEHNSNQTKTNPIKMNHIKRNKINTDHIKSSLLSPLPYLLSTVSSLMSQHMMPQQ